MFKIAFLAFVVSLGWYMGGEVYGKQQRAPFMSPTDSNTPKQKSAMPDLTEERIDLLRRIAAVSNEEELPEVHTSTTDTGTLVTSMTGVTTGSLGSDLVSNHPSVDSGWEISLHVDKYTGVKEGLAYSGWTALSPSLKRPDDKIQASLVASCNDEGERSLYIRMLSAYPGFETAQNVNKVTAQVGWDSSNPYSAPFTYDVRSNALRLQAGVEDSLSMIKDGKNVTIHLPWYDGHKADFKFSLTGSSHAIDKVFDYCLSQVAY